MRHWLTVEIYGLRKDYTENSAQLYTNLHFQVYLFIYSLFKCLHDQNKSGFFGGPAFFQPIRA